MKLLNFDESIKLDHKIVKKYYKNHVNKGLAIAFKILGYDKLNIKSAYGCNLYLEDGTVILDMTAGIGVLALGHNHEKIIEVEQKFHRLKIGIALEDINMKPSEKYVLTSFPKKYHQEVEYMITHATDSIDFYLNNTMEKTMNKYNVRLKEKNNND